MNLNYLKLRENKEVLSFVKFDENKGFIYLFGSKLLALHQGKVSVLRELTM
mgnify:CR=1 FL=1